MSIQIEVYRFESSCAEVETPSCISFDLPASDVWHVVQEDSVVGSSEEEENAASSAGLFKKLAKTCRQDNTNTKAQSKGIKKVAPGQKTKMLTTLYFLVVLFLG